MRQPVVAYLALPGVALINVGAFGSSALAMIGLTMFAPLGWRTLAGLAAEHGEGV